MQCKRKAQSYIFINSLSALYKIRNICYNNMINLELCFVFALIRPKTPTLATYKGGFHYAK